MKYNYLINIMQVIDLSNDIFGFLGEELSLFEDALYEAVKTPLPLITDIGTKLVSAGGKRMRPALCLLSAKTASKYDLEHVMPLAVAFEIIHMASLVHDDVLDEADMRRGVATVNATLGNKIAVLSGDYMFAQAFNVVSEKNYGEKAAKKIAAVIGGLTSGEIIQDASVFVCGDEDDYYERIDKKTAAFFAVCCELGAYVCGGEEKLTEALYKYGHALGMAFQITDDLLDIEGSSSVIGKPAGNDLKQGIITLPVIKALETSDKRDALSRIVTDSEMSEEMLAEALEIVRASDGIEYSQRKAQEYLTEARDAIKGIVPEPLFGNFVRVLDFIGKRDS